MRVYLLRHGIAEDYAASGSDADRALTEEGERRLEQACAVYRRLVDANLRIHASPLRRAQQTAAVLQRSLGGHIPIASTELLVPGARPMLALELLQRELLGGTPAVALVGHEPHLGHLFGMMLTGSEHASIPLKKGMLVGLEVAAAQTMLARLLFSLGQKSAIALG